MRTITKKELVSEISDEVGLTRKQVSQVLESFLGEVTDHLSEGNSVALRNFGSFEVKVTKEKVAHNPKNIAQKVTIPERAVVKFKPGKDLKQQVMLALPKLK